MVNYQNGKIYTIRSPSINKYYIGSSCSPLFKRYNKHKSDYTKYQNGSTWLSSFEILKFDDAYIELLENYPCNSKEELLMREGQLIRQYKDDIVNKNRPNLTHIEYNEYHKQYNQEHSEIYKKYRDDNKEQFKKYNDIHNEKKYRCEICNIEIRNTGKYGHIKSKNHKDKLESP
jgi:hypothetical protein